MGLRQTPSVVESSPCFCTGDPMPRFDPSPKHANAPTRPRTAKATRGMAGAQLAHEKTTIQQTSWQVSELARTFFTSQAWSVQPCVRPVSAVHMTAGHNALRGSGPGQKPAFDDAVAHVGCPDRRIDRLCITCCSPSQPSHHAECRRDLVTPPVRRVPCSAHPWPSWPTPFLRSCWRVRSRRPSSAAALTTRVSQGRCLVPWILA